MNEDITSTDWNQTSDTAVIEKNPTIKIRNKCMFHSSSLTLDIRFDLFISQKSKNSNQLISHLLNKIGIRTEHCNSKHNNNN